MQKIVARVLVGPAVLTDVRVIAAQAGHDDCNANRACIYQYSSYRGKIGDRGPGDPRENVWWANDRMTSWNSRTDRYGAWYEHNDGGGKCYTMSPHTRNPSVWAGNNSLSSWKVDGGC